MNVYESAVEDALRQTGNYDDAKRRIIGNRDLYAQGTYPWSYWNAVLSLLKSRHEEN